MCCLPQPGARHRRPGAIQALTGNPNVEFMPLDVAVQQSVRDFAAAYTQAHSRLHVLINNAAIFTAHRSTTPDGLETMFATNHLGPFLLTQLLLEVLKASALARVINITGPAATRVRLDDLQSEYMFLRSTRIRRLAAMRGRLSWRAAMGAA
ncbi:MAG: SDR family NAD(P)-dependent oxidoreductase [Kouleothrix sp.]